MAQRETAWCLGAAELGRRPLAEEQRRVLGARLAQARRALKLWRTGWLTFWSAAVLLYPFCHEALAAGSAKPGAVPFLYFLFCSGPAAVLMAATELITGWSRLLRWIFVALGLGVLTLALESTFVGFASILAIYLGGTFAWAARWQIFRRLRTLLPELEADLREGVVAVFEVNRPEGEKPPATLSRAKVRFDGTPVRFAVLPRTGVLVDVAGRFVDTFLSFDRSWDPLDVTVTAQGTGYRAPIDGAPAELHDKIGQRHATPAELAEIATHCKRLLRRGVAGFFVGTYFSAFGVRFVEMFIEGRMNTGVSPVGWTIAVAIGIFVAWRSLGPRFALRRAAESARLVAMRNEGAKPGEPTDVELLMGTDMPWTIDGKPAPWRTVKW